MDRQPKKKQTKNPYKADSRALHTRMHLNGSRITLQRNNDVSCTHEPRSHVAPAQPTGPMLTTSEHHLLTHKGGIHWPTILPVHTVTVFQGQQIYPVGAAQLHC